MFIVQSCNRFGDWNTVACVKRVEAMDVYAEARNDEDNVLVALEDDQGRRFSTATRPEVAGVEYWN